MPHVVLKFGGTSIAGPEQWRVVGDVVAQRLGEGLRPVVVHSALPGVTDLLSSLLDGGDTERDEGLATLSRRVWALASELDVREEVEADVGRELEQLRAALDGLPRGAPGRRDLGPEAWRRQAGSWRPASGW